MFNLVEQFLDKFQQQPDLSYSRIREQKTQQDHSQQNALKEQKNQEPKPLDITVMPNFPSAEDSFYQKPSIPVDKLGLKLLNLKEQLQRELELAELHYTKKILTDMIQNLNDILSANDTQTVKTVVYRIE